MQTSSLENAAEHDPAREVLRELSLLIRHLARISGGAEDDTPLTGTQRLALYELFTGGPMRLNDLAARLGVSAPTASRAIDALVEVGLVDRLRDPDDRRALRLGLTAAGQARASEREVRVATAFAPALEALSASERDQLVGLLARLSAQVGLEHGL
jgi:DNA-binding MarR family transcriptional regulator